MTPLRRLLPVFVLLAIPGACGVPAPESVAEMRSTDQAVFWMRVRRLCGKAYEGRLVEGNATDSAFRTERLVMHAHRCGEGETRIAFHLGEDRSRTWVLTQTRDGLRLKHDHRHEDGT